MRFFGGIAWAVARCRKHRARSSGDSSYFLSTKPRGVPSQPLDRSCWTKHFQLVSANVRQRGTHLIYFVFPNARSRQTLPLAHKVLARKEKNENCPDRSALHPHPAQNVWRNRAVYRPSGRGAKAKWSRCGG